MYYLTFLVYTKENYSPLCHWLVADIYLASSGHQFHWWFMRHSLLHTLLQLGVGSLYPCFPIWCSGNSNFGFCNKFLFLGAGSAFRPTPNLEDQGLFFVWLLTFDQPGMVRPARDLSPRRHSSRGHWDTQGPPPWQGVSLRWRPRLFTAWQISSTSHLLFTLVKLLMIRQTPYMLYVKGQESITGNVMSYSKQSSK